MKAAVLYGGAVKLEFAGFAANGLTETPPGGLEKGLATTEAEANPDEAPFKKGFVAAASGVLEAMKGLVVGGFTSTTFPKEFTI